MCLPLLPDALAEVWAQLREAAHLAVFLDFDGTLAPIADHPAEARLDARAKAVLEKLAAREDLLLVFISGRSAGDLRSRIEIGSAVYAGNHGLEITGRVQFVEPAAFAKQGLLKRIVESLVVGLRHIHGAWVEDKNLTATVHFRQANPREERAIANIVHAALAHHSALFQLNAGKKVFEIVPRTKWHKGAAVCWINARLSGDGTTSIYIGDDRTDEDAFVHLPGAVTIHVGGAAETAARYCLDDTLQVCEFLEWLTEQRKSV